MYYPVVGVLALIILLCENRDILRDNTDAFKARPWQIYRRFLFAVMFYYIVDALWGVAQFYGQYQLFFAITTIYFIAMAIVIVFWSQYVIVYMDERSSFGQILMSIGHTIASTVIIITIVNIFVPVLFVIKDGVYQALPIRYVVLLCQIAILLVISIYSFPGIRRNGRNGQSECKYLAVALFGLIMAAFLIIQLWFAYLPLYSIAYMLGTCLLHSFVLGNEKEEYHHKLMEIENQRATGLIGEELLAYKRLNSLVGDYMCVYSVVPETERYHELSSSDDYKSLNVPGEGQEFFEIYRQQAKRVIYPQDLERFLTLFTRQNMLSEIERSGIFAVTYRIMLDGEPGYVQLKAAMVEEDEGPRLIVGIQNIDAFVKQEETYAKILANARNMARTDALTGVKNKYSYLDEEQKLDQQVSDGHINTYAIVILDINDLKKINDTKGHQAGDKYICDACSIICKTFKQSPVFRVGGDEFAVVAQGDDYFAIDLLMQKIHDHNEKAIREDGIVIACGMARFDGNEPAASVYKRADKAMYDNKANLKNIANVEG